MHYFNKFLIILILCVSIFIDSSNISQAVSYDYQGHWAEQTIRLWIEKGYIKMYEDGTFRPDEPISRVEFITMINKLFNFTDLGEMVFKDISIEDWYYQDVLRAQKAGYILGGEDANLEPGRNITREEASAMLGRVLAVNFDLSEKEEYDLQDFKDVSNFAKAYVKDLAGKELLKGYGDKTFRPTGAMTRGEAVMVIDRAANLLKMERTYYSDKVAVLMYHSVREDFKYDTTINVEIFKEQLKMLKKCGFNVITLDDFLNFMDGKASVPKNAVLITFDDGYEDFYKLAYPILKELDLSATMFAITSKIGDKSGWNPKIDRAQMKTMDANNIFFGSHSHDSHYLVKNMWGKEDSVLATKAPKPEGGYESKDEYLARVKDDLTKSKEVLNDILNQDTRVLATPYGRGNSSVKKVSKLVGLDYIFTVKPGIVHQKTDSMSLPRLNAGYSSISADELKNIILRHAKDRG